MVPMWPSAAGITAKSAGRGAAQPARTAAASSGTRKRKAALVGVRSVHLYHELGATHAHHGRGGADLHRLGRLLHHLAGDRGELALLEVALELARMGGGVEAIFVDREHGIRTDRHEAVVGEG